MALTLGGVEKSAKNQKVEPTPKNPTKIAKNKPMTIH
jgi:hypothetical protein